MNKYGLIGNNISESLSPSLFKVAYADKYIYDLIENDDFITSWKRFLSDYKAINITSPFKEKAFEEVVKLTLKGEGNISGPCMRIGATNIVIKENNEIIAHNTDFTGVILSIAECLFPGITSEFYQLYKNEFHIKTHIFCKKRISEIYSDKPQALIVGCGGAGKAAAVAAAEIGYDVAIMNRDLDKVSKFSANLPEYKFIASPLSDFIPAVKECDLIIYTLPIKIDEINKLGLSDLIGERKENDQSPRKIIFEANYNNPAFSPDIIIKLMSAGCNYISGMQWLMNQALTGYSIMTGEAPDYRAMLEKGF